MHSLVRRYLKTGIAFLALGPTLGLWMMAERELFERDPGPRKPADLDEPPERPFGPDDVEPPRRS